ncbi:hypothetical protein M378DRAFT_192118 [Amanita muscaria Koide BX008]|uniref:Rho-GAP domain-containing protein n=1 Tax=Amanita muscaria (strain Koide BX008) TaxID=946122 RepID=A0A0C2X9X5_AMAMK|nr:hypothetical protein M378DRAFT_192118 [Amanita muscaria Koide BX008]
MSTEDLVASFLSPSEQVKVALETQISSDNNEAEVINVLSDEKETRILAVISHFDEWSMTEEGCVFVCSYKHLNNGPGSSKDLHIQRAYPIFGRFAISMAQNRRMTLDVRTGAVQPAAQPRTGFSVTIHDPSIRVPAHTYCTDDVKKLQQFVQECKRLKELFEAPEKTEKQLSTQFVWMAPYVNELASLSDLLSDIPPDLRIVNEPLIDRLSHCNAGLPGDDIADLRLIRDFWIRTKGQELCLKGSYRLSVRIGTFNVNGKLPSQDLSTWIGGPASLPAVQGDFPSLGIYTDETQSTKAPDLKHLGPMNSSGPCPSFTLPRDESDVADSGPDLLVLGFQELDHSAEAYIYTTNAAKEDAWCHAVIAGLGELGPRYDKLISRQLVGMFLVIFVRKPVAPYFTDVKTGAVGAGLMGVMGNKGATAVRLTFTPKQDDREGVNTPKSTVLTFVNAHLAAFDEMVDRRNVDFHDLSKRLIFETRVEQEEEIEEGIDASIPWIGLFNTDALFWLGDLNYRIDLPDIDIREILSSKIWENKDGIMQEHDQLIKSRRTGKAFTNFHEAQIRFPPTYRFTPGILTDGYNSKRKPAWTDRILLLAGPTVKIRQLSYSNHPKITMSDHRPVLADFEINVGLWDIEEHEILMHKLMRESRHMEEAVGRSMLKVLTPTVDFGKVHYMRPAIRTVKLQNTGKVPTTYRFVPIHGETSIHPSWLRIEPMTGILLPDDIAEIAFTFFADNVAARTLNLSERALKATVILHSLLGKDHFISITGEYQYTCFATSLERLTRLSGPVRTLNSPLEYLPDHRAKNAPREVMRLVNWMMAGSARVENLFFTPAEDVYIHSIRECLDTGDEFPYPPGSEDDRIHLAFGATLLQFLESLSSPVVPVFIHERCLQATDRDEAFESLDAFPSSSVNAWISITAFLHYICRSSQDPVLRAKRLASVFAPVLMREERAHVLNPISLLGKQRFILYFID